MAKIAEALSVSSQTVSTDLRRVSSDLKLPARGGRPRKAPSILDPDQPATVTPDQRETILKLAEEGVAQRDIAGRVGLSDIPIRRVIEHERGRREAIREERERQEVALIQRRTHACPTCGTVHVVGDASSAQVPVDYWDRLKETR
jgi:IS30 family transposase